MQVRASARMKSTHGFIAWIEPRVQEPNRETAKTVSPRTGDRGEERRPAGQDVTRSESNMPDLEFMGESRRVFSSKFLRQDVVVAKILISGGLV
jgi:hypothetical protein